MQKAASQRRCRRETAGAQLARGEGWAAVERFEAAMAERARPAAEGAAEGLRNAVSPAGAANVLDHCRERAAG